MRPTPDRASAQTRSLTLGERTLAYTLKRSRRRTIGLAIDHRGLRVAAPLRAPLREIESLLQNHQQWVIDKLDLWASREPAVAEMPVIEDGLQFPLLGDIWTLRLLRTTQALTHWSDSTRTLTLHLRPNSDPATAFRRVLAERAREDFSQRIRHLVDQAANLNPALHLHPPPLALSSARTRWGSCSRRCLRLNRHLVHLRPALVDYVVAHELAHLIEMNHSPRFWAVVERIEPNWQAARQALRTEGRTCPRF